MGEELAGSEMNLRFDFGELSRAAICDLRLGKWDGRQIEQRGAVGTLV